MGRLEPRIARSRKRLPVDKLLFTKSYSCSTRVQSEAFGLRVQIASRWTIARQNGRCVMSVRIHMNKRAKLVHGNKQATDSKNLHKSNRPLEDGFKTVRRRKQEHLMGNFGALKRIAVKLSTNTVNRKQKILKKRVNFNSGNTAANRYLAELEHPSKAPKCPEMIQILVGISRDLGCET